MYKFQESNIKQSLGFSDNVIPWFLSQEETQQIELIMQKAASKELLLLCTGAQLAFGRLHYFLTPNERSEAPRDHLVLVARLEEEGYDPVNLAAWNAEAIADQVISAATDGLCSCDDDEEEKEEYEYSENALLNWIGFFELIAERVRCEKERVTSILRNMDSKCDENQ